MKNINKLDLSYIDVETGELIEGRPDCPFRSLTDNKNFDPRERKSTLPSKTVANGWQSIQSLYERCMRFPAQPSDFDDDMSDDYHYEDTPDVDELEAVQEYFDAVQVSNLKPSDSAISAEQAPKVNSEVVSLDEETNEK